MALSDNLQLISYLAAAEAFNQGRNIFDSFQPIIESAIMSKIQNDSISFLALQKELNDTYFLSVPKATLRCLLEKLQKQGKITFLERKRIIPNKNELNQTFWESRNEREAAVEDFFLEFNNYLTEKSIDIPFPEIKNQCCNWLYLHSLELATFISKGKLEIRNSQQGEWVYANQLTSFLLEIHSKKSTQFKTFLYIYNGAVQASLLNFEPQQIDNLCELEVNLPNVILDTNFILRILNLQSEFDVSAATDTLNNLKSGNTRFFVLEQTLDEICRSIKKFLPDTQPSTGRTSRYLQVRMTGFWDAYRRGVSRTDFLELTKKTKLKEAILSHVDVTFIEDFDDASISEKDINDLIVSKNKDGYFEKSARHDLALLEYCRKNRRKRLVTVADIDWWVLTNDERLAFWNQSNCDEYQECLTEIQLSNLLWLQKKRDVNSGLFQTVVSLSNNTAVSPQSIAEFASKLQSYQELHKDDKTKIDKISLLFHSNMLTAEDIQRINSEEDAFDQVLEEKVLNYKIEQNKQQQRFNDSQEEGIRLAAQNEELRIIIESVSNQLNVERLERQIDKHNKDIAESKRERKALEKDLENLSKMKKYSDAIAKSTPRYLCIILTIPIIILLLVCVKYGYPFITEFLQAAEKIPNVVQTIYCLVLPGVLMAIYYFLVVMIFKTPKSPKELFSSLCSKFLSFRLHHFMRKNNIPYKYNSENIESDILSANQDIQSIGHRISSWENNIASIKEKIEMLAQPQSA